MPLMRIAAVVNDQVISVFDVISRMRIVMISSNLPDTPDTRKRLAGQVLHELIDEKLELQEAKRKGVTASDAELKAALGIIEKQNHMQPGQLNAFLKAQHIDRGTLVDQLTASIVWGKLVRRRAAETTEITDEEIDAALKRAKENEHEPQTRVAEIFLSVDTPAQDQEVLGTANRLIEQMRAGARFSAMARQFSQSATAAVGGDLGWLRPDQLQPALAKAVADLRPGELSPPIRTAGGYYIMLVLGRRGGGASAANQDMVYDIVQVVFPIPNNATEAQKQAAALQAVNVGRASKDCAEMLRIGKERAPKLSSEGHLRASGISPALRKLIDHLKINQPSQPILQRNGVGILMVCGKGVPPPTKITREEVIESLTRDRLDAVARRYLRDLRRNAYVDIRA
ncbi:MAG: foldase protein PrsA [Stellaceae bacterium]